MSSSIQTRLTLLALAVLGPAVVLGAAATYYVYHGQREAHGQSVRHTVRALAQVVEKEIARREDLLHLLALSPQLDKADLAGFYELAHRVAPRWDAVIVLADPSGQQVLNTRRPFPSPQPLPRNVSFPDDRARFGALATIVSPLYVAPIGRQPSFAIEVPVVRDGKVIYYIGMGSFASQMQGIFSQLRPPEGWTVAVLDRDGKIVARNIEPEKHVGQPARDDLIEHSRGAEEGYFETTTRDGMAVEAFFRRVPRAGWTLAVGLPRDQAVAGARRAALAAGGAALALLALSLGVAAAFGRGIARPVRRLVGDAARLGRGEPLAAPTSGLGEVDAVSEAMAQASRALREANADMQRRVADAVAAAERSQRDLLQAQKLDALGRLTGGIAHDFNNLLQTLATGLQLVALKPLDADAKLAVESCRRAVGQATRLTRQLSGFARGQSSHAERLDLRNRLLSMAELLQGALRSDIELRFDLASDLWPVEVDAMQLELALINLAINARDALPGPGHVEVRAANISSVTAHAAGPAGDFVTLSMRDDGQGMSAEVRERAMDPFFTTKGVGRGSGLGLAQVYAFCKHSGGTVTLDSEPGRGTVVTMCLPRARSAPAAEPAERSAAGSERLTVMLVEDEAMIRDIAAPALRGHGFEVVVAATGEEALQRLEGGERVQAVFSDIVMPGRYSGIDLADLVNHRFPGVAVLLATGYSEQLASVRRFPVVAKPYDVADVAARLRALVQRQAA